MNSPPVTQLVLTSVVMSSIGHVKTTAAPESSAECIIHSDKDGYSKFCQNIKVDAGKSSYIFSEI
jgi:hypothetical protein